jgi:hypothetical protein
VLSCCSLIEEWGAEREEASSKSKMSLIGPFHIPPHSVLFVCAKVCKEGSF